MDRWMNERTGRKLEGRINWMEGSNGRDNLACGGCRGKLERMSRGEREGGGSALMFPFMLCSCSCYWMWKWEVWR